MISWDEYYMGIAQAVAKRASCSRRQVGAIIVVDRAIVSTGYNGTPSGTPNCNEGGCERCAGSSATGASYDTCICVHAEANAILLAARRGTRTAHGTIYCTLRPCIGCVKESIQAGIVEFVFRDNHALPDTVVRQYDHLILAAGVKLRNLPTTNPV